VFGTMNERGIRKYRTCYLETPKKNGKSELVGAVALLHLFNKDEPQTPDVAF
jgi:phage terminase large subunit-like protein